MISQSTTCIFFSDSPFTGLFKGGRKVIGFMRMSWSAPNFLDISTQPGLTPGVSIKFLRSGTSSANFVTTNSMESLPDKDNFFSTPLSNHIPAENSTTTQSRRFCSTGHCINKVGLSNICTHDQEGIEYQEPIFPFKVTFEPLVKIKSNNFIGLSSGTRFYNIKANRSPNDQEGFNLGEVVSNDDCISSLYGDTKMFFKHQWIEEDVALRPGWSESYYNDCYCNLPLV